MTTHGEGFDRTVSLVARTSWQSDTSSRFDTTSRRMTLSSAAFFAGRRQNRCVIPRKLAAADKSVMLHA